MSDILDRLVELFKSWTAPDYDDRQFSAFRPSAGRSGDADFDDAMAELEADLAGDRAAREKLERDREARRRAEEAFRDRGRPSGSADSLREKLAADYRTLGVPVGSPFAEVKAAYKRLQKLHHPDRHQADPESARKATKTSARINAAYSRLERYAETGAFPADD
ncbi:MAG: J domain-containing protein [Spirochaetales bacterium]|nr:J domain-containing protein [Spirochaetales bacterium]